MALENPVLRGGVTPAAPYPFGRIPDSVIYSISRDIVHSFAVGRADITGDEWADMFAGAIGAEHLQSPLGVTDVTLPGAAWSAKTVQASDVSRIRTVRLISGRNAVGLSFKNEAPRADPQIAGDQVLQIWNARVEQARNEFRNLRTVVLIRDVERFHFKVFELEPQVYDTSAYEWVENKRGNFEGRLKDDNDVHVFTWQPAGAQFTIRVGVPPSGRAFDLRKPPRLDAELQLRAIGYAESWVTLRGPEVSALRVVSAPVGGLTYKYGDRVRLACTFTGRVSVIGAPSLRIRVGTNNRDAIYVSGSGTSELVFRYFVGRGDRAPVGVRVEADSLMLNGGGISGVANGLAAVLSHARLPSDKNHKVRSG